MATKVLAPAPGRGAPAIKSGRAVRCGTAGALQAVSSTSIRGQRPAEARPPERRGTNSPGVKSVLLLQEGERVASKPLPVLERRMIDFRAERTRSRKVALHQRHPYPSNHVSGRCVSPVPAPAIKLAPVK